jgi:hypothetical protein
MSALSTAAKQALEALEDMLGWQSLAPQTIQESAKGRAAALKAALAEPATLDEVMAGQRALAQAYENGWNAAKAEPVQEPVAWRTFDGEGGYDYRTYEDNEDYAAEWAKRNPRHVGWVEPLYTTPPQRKPLTEEEIQDCFYAARTAKVGSVVVEIARAIEQAHGITP